MMKIGRREIMSASKCPFCGSKAEINSTCPINSWKRIHCNSCGYLITDDSSYSFGDKLRISYNIKLLRLNARKLEEPVYIGRDLNLYSKLVQKYQTLAVVYQYGYYLPENN